MNFVFFIRERVGCSQTNIHIHDQNCRLVTSTSISPQESRKLTSGYDFRVKYSVDATTFLVFR